MKLHPFLHSSIKTALGCLVITGVAVIPVAAQDSAKELLLRNGADQADVSAHTAAVTNQIQALIDELAANGISGSDAKVLQATKSALSTLSTKEMARVIAALQKAAQAPNLATAKTAAVGAYSDQKGIIAEFQMILKDYEQRQAAYELPVRFKELTDKQTETMTTTRDVARASAGMTQYELSTLDSTTQQIVQTDQEALLNDVNVAKQEVDAAVQDGTGDDVQPLVQAQQDLKTGKLQQALAEAANDLKSGNLFKAIAAQQVATSELHRITRDLNPPADLVQALTEASAELDKLIGEQKKLLSETDSAINNKVMFSGLGDEQGGLVLEANTVQDDMLALSPAASGLIKEAINPPMQTSRAQLASQAGFPNAVTAQQDAINKLEEAQKLLEQQLADAKKAEEEANKDEVTQLQDLKKQIESDMTQQKQETDQTAQAMADSQPDLTAATQQQAAVQQQTAALQQNALPLSMTTAQALANAADEMNQAQQAMTNPANTANTPADQQAAQAALAQADKDVDQEIAQAQQTPADPAALQAAADDLQKAEDDAGDANADATPPSGQNSTAPDMAQAAAALAQAEKDTDAATAAAPLPDNATSAVADAKADIAQGKTDAGKNDAPGTAAAAAAAEAALAKAQAATALAAAGMQPGNEKGNQPGGNAPAPPSVAGWAKVPPGHDQASLTGAKTVSGGSTDKGTLHGVAGNGKFITVAARDRDVVDQSQGEKRPQEYAPLIDQYMKNLADQSTDSAQ